MGAEPDSPHPPLQAAERAVGLTRQLLAYSRKQVLQPAVVDLNALLDEQSAMLERLIGEDVELELHSAPGLGRVLADPGQLQQVVMNLAVNARDAMPEGGRLSITTSNEDLAEDDPLRPAAMPPGPYVRLVVSDTGHGMTEEVRAHLFEPFFTTKDPGKGTGLGLSTIYGIVTQSGGSIQIDSAAGRGTTAGILLPRLSGGSEAAPLEEARPARPAEGAARLVLLVEDDAALRALMQEVLESAGFRVLAAGNGEQGAALARERAGEAIDLLLTDVVLPKRGGLELAADVRAVHPETRVILTSGYTADGLHTDGALHAGDAFLQKPVSPDRLLAKIAEVLGDEPPAQLSPPASTRG